jgi:hypothetical protein
MVLELADFAIRPGQEDTSAAAACRPLPSRRQNAGRDEPVRRGS